MIFRNSMGDCKKLAHFTPVNKKRQPSFLFIGLYTVHLFKLSLSLHIDIIMYICIALPLFVFPLCPLYCFSVGVIVPTFLCKKI